MDLDPSSPDRGTRPSVSTALIVGLLIGVTVAALRPVSAPLSRDAASQRLATRHLAQTIARAVRELAGADRDRPALTWGHQVRLTSDVRIRGEVAGEVASTPVRLLRETLLSLPPPLT